MKYNDATQCKYTPGVLAPVPRFFCLNEFSQAVTECLLQRIEPRLEMLPMVDAGLVDRLAYLFRTRRAHGTFVFEETQNAVLERQSAVVEQGAHFAFGIADHAFVDRP